MAGPGIRYHYMAQELSDLFNVTVGFFDPTYLPKDDFEHSYKTLHIHAPTFEKGFKGFDVIIALWLSESMIDYCNRNKIFTVFDLYAPVPVENLAKSIFNEDEVMPEHEFEYSTSLEMYRKFFENGDLFICSNRRQLDFWIGYVFGANQITLSTYRKRMMYERFIYAPMGIDLSTPLKHTKNVMKGVLPDIKESDSILLWTGGIWGWYDGKVLILAMHKLLKLRPNIKLVFFGTQHPNPGVPEMKESYATRQLADKLGLTNKNVFFNSGWVPYRDRINYLLEASAAVNTHKESIEMEFSHRTRVLDHILSELPSVTTEGDYLSDSAIRGEGMGITVPAGDPEQLVKAIIDVLKPQKRSQIINNIRNQKPQYDWAVTMQELKDFIGQNPSKLHVHPIASRLKRSHPAVRSIKKAIPLPVKKAIIRIIRKNR